MKILVTQWAISTIDQVPLDVADVIRETKMAWDCRSSLDGSTFRVKKGHALGNYGEVKEQGHKWHGHPCRRIQDSEDAVKLELEAKRNREALQKRREEQEAEERRKQELAKQKRQEDIAAFWHKEGRDIWARRREVTMAGIPLLLLERPAQERVERGGKVVSYESEAKAVLLQILPDSFESGRVSIERGGITARTPFGQVQPRPGFWSGSSYSLPANGYEMELVYNEFH